MADGREIEVTNIRNLDRGARYFNQGARGHAIALARDAGVQGEVIAVEKLPHDLKRHARRVAEAIEQARRARFNRPRLRLSTEDGQ